MSEVWRACGRSRSRPSARPDLPGPEVPPYTQPLPPPPYGATPSLGMTQNMAGALCYLFGFITGILFLVLAPYNQDRTIRFHAFQSIFLNIAWFLIWVVITIITLGFRVIPFLGIFISFVLHFAIGLGGLFLWLYMMFKTYNGEKIVLPVVGAMAEKQAGV